MDQTEWPDIGHEVMPDKFWEKNELGFEMPDLPSTVPGEPKVFAETAVVGNDGDDITLGYEIDYPAEVKDYPPNLPGADTTPDLPELPAATIDMPTLKIDESSFPENFGEKARIPKMPATIYDGGKMTLGKVPKPLKPKMFQKVLNTIPMPMKIKNVPFKPVGEPRTQR